MYRWSDPPLHRPHAASVIKAGTGNIAALEAGFAATNLVEQFKFNNIWEIMLIVKHGQIHFQLSSFNFQVDRLVSMFWNIIKQSWCCTYVNILTGFGIRLTAVRQVVIRSMRSPGYFKTKIMPIMLSLKLFLKLKPSTHRQNLMNFK